MTPAKLERYQPFFMKKLSFQRDDLSGTGWVNGIYVAKAIGSCLSKKSRYPSSPLQLFEEVSEAPDDDALAKRDLNRFMAIASMFNAAHPELGGSLIQDEDTETVFVTADDDTSDM